MPLSKKQKTESKEIELCENVRLLRSGAWGYIHNKVAIFQSTDVGMVNEFSRHVEERKLKNPIGVDGIFQVLPIEVWAAEWQKLEGEPKILPKCHLCDAPHWSSGSNNYEAVVRQQSIMTNK
jgi:hypothetical protein